MTETMIRDTLNRKHGRFPIEAVLDNFSYLDKRNSVVGMMREKIPVSFRFILEELCSGYYQAELLKCFLRLSTGIQNEA